MHPRTGSQARALQHQLTPRSTRCRSWSRREAARSTTDLTWHGSAPNTSGTVARMALVSHLIPAETRFHETNVDVTYSRYRRRGDLSLDESFFPVVWDESGYRTPWLADLPDLG